MHIAIVALPYVSIPPKKYGGTERVIFNLIKGLMELGHEVTLLATGDSDVSCRLVPICEYQLPTAENLEEEKKLVPLRREAMERISLELRRLKGEVDIIHSHGYSLKGFSGTPNVTTLHNPIRMDHYIDFFRMDYYGDKLDQWYVSISKNQQAGRPDLKYAGVVYNGIDPAPFPFVERPDDYLCFIGRLDPEKQPHTAIQLAMKLGKKIKIGAKIDLGGSDYFEKCCRSYLDSPLVEFLGEVNEHEKIEVVSNAMCNLHPTGFREPFGLTIVEAGFCGTPTLAINKGSMAEIIEDGRTGLLVEDFDEGLHRIQECFEMDRNYISVRNKNLFTHVNMAKGYLKIYQKIIDSES